jgi:hypothetical protein
VENVSGKVVASNEVERDESDEPIKLSLTHTSCQDCVFAEYEDRTQVACAAGRVGHYGEQNCLVEAENELGQFYIINGRECPLKRVEPWGTEWEMPEKLDRARQEATIKVAAIVVLQQELISKETVLDSLQCSFLGISDNNFHEVVVVSNQAHIPHLEVYKALEEFGQNNPTVTCKFVRVFLDEDGNYKSLRQAWDDGVAQVSSQFYCMVSPGRYPPPGLPHLLDRAIIDNFARFIVVLPSSLEEYHGLTVHVRSHRRADVSGNRGIEYDVDGTKQILTNVEDKLAWLADFHNKPELLAPAGFLCTSC